MPVGDLPESVTLGGWRWQVTVTADEFGVRRLLIDGIPDGTGGSPWTPADAPAQLGRSCSPKPRITATLRSGGGRGEHDRFRWALLILSAAAVAALLIIAPQTCVRPKQTRQVKERTG